MEHVYHYQLKTLLNADIACLAHIAYPEMLMDLRTDGLRNHKTRKALILARLGKLFDALARAVEFETAK